MQKSIILVFSLLFRLETVKSIDAETMAILDNSEWFAVEGYDAENDTTTVRRFDVAADTNATWRNDSSAAVRFGHWSLIGCEAKGHVFVCDMDRLISLPRQRFQIYDALRFYIDEHIYKVGGSSKNSSDRDVAVATTRKPGANVNLQICFYCKPCLRPKRNETCSLAKAHSTSVSLGFAIGFVFATTFVAICVRTR